MPNMRERFVDEALTPVVETSDTTRMAAVSIREPVESTSYAQ